MAEDKGGSSVFSGDFMSKWNIRDMLLLVAAGAAFTGSLMSAHAFYTAYMSAEKSVTIQINNYGEADFEAFVTFPIILIGAVVMVSNAFICWAKTYIENYRRRTIL